MYKRRATTILSEAMSLNLQGRSIKAKEVLNEGLILYPKDADFYVSKGAVFHNSGEVKEALNLFNEALSLDSQNKMAHFNKGNALYDLEDKQGAIECYSKVIEIDPQYIEAYYCKGLCLNELGEQDQAIECYNEILKWEPESDMAYYFKATILHQKNLYKEAVDLYAQALKINYKNDSALYKLGQICSFFGREKEAFHNYNLAKHLDPENPIYYNSQANASHALSRKTQAINLYEIAYSKAPNDAVYLYNKAIVLFEIEEFEQAIKCYKRAFEMQNETTVMAFKALSSHPDSLDSYLLSKKHANIQALYIKNQAEVLKSFNEYEIAIDLYEQAFKIDPTDSLTCKKTGQILYSLDRYFESIKCFNQVLSLDVSDIYSYLYNILAHYSVGKEEEAEVLIRALASLEHEEEVIGFLIAEQWRDKEEYIAKEARVLWQLILCSQGYKNHFNLITSRCSNFGLKISPNNTLFSSILQSTQSDLIAQMLATNKPFDEYLEILVRNLDDSEALKAIKQAYDYGLKDNIERQCVVLMKLAFSSHKYQIIEYLYKVDNSTINCLTEPDIKKLILVFEDTSIALTLQEKFKFEFADEFCDALTSQDQNVGLINNILILQPNLLEQTYNGEPLGHFALKRADMQLIELLLLHDLNLEGRCDVQNHNLLTVALMQGKFDIAELLITQFNFASEEPLCILLDSANNDTVFCIPLSIIESLDDSHMNNLLYHLHINSLRDEKGNTVLHVAVERGNEEFITNHLDRLFQMINVQNQSGLTPMHILLNSKYSIYLQCKILELLLKAPKIDITLPDENGYTAIDIAATFKPYIFEKFYQAQIISSVELSDPKYLHNKELVVVLFTSKIKLGDVFERMVVKLESYPLHYACFTGDVPSIRKLLNDQSNIPDCWGYLPLYYAVAQSRLNVIEYFIEQKHSKIDFVKANSRPNSTTLIHKALSVDNSEIIECLFKVILDNGLVNLNIKGQFNSSLIHEIRSPQVAEFLVKLFAKAAETDPSTNQIIDIDSRDYQGHTALYYASQLKDIKLLQYWFRLSAQNPSKYPINISLNKSILSAAAFKGNTAIISYLLDKCPDKFSLDNYIDEDMNPIESSLYWKGPKTIDFLFKRYKQSYLLVKDPYQLKKIAEELGSQDLQNYLVDNLTSILWNQMYLKSDKRDQEIKKYLQQQLDGIRASIKQTEISEENAIFGSFDNSSDSSKNIHPILNIFRKQLITLRSGYENLQENQKQQKEIIFLSGIEERAKILNEINDLKSIDPRIYNYYTAFCYSFSSYITAYKALNSGVVQSAAVEKNKDVAAILGMVLVANAVKEGVKSVPVVGSIVGFLDSIMIGIYKNIKYIQLQDKMRIITKILQEKVSMEDEVNTYIAKAGLNLAKLKTQVLIATNTSTEPKLCRLNTRFQEVKKKLLGLKENLVDKVEDMATVLAIHDVAGAMGYLYTHSEEIISEPKPFNEQLVRIVINIENISPRSPRSPTELPRNPFKSSPKSLSPPNLKQKDQLDQSKVFESGKTTPELSTSVSAGNRFFLFNNEKKSPIAKLQIRSIPTVEDDLKVLDSSCMSDLEIDLAGFDNEVCEVSFK